MGNEAQARDRVMQLAIIAVGSQAVADQQEIARGGELRARDEQSAVQRNMRPQPPHERCRMSLFGQPDMPALIETGLGAETAHAAGDIDREVPLMADLK